MSFPPFLFHDFPHMLFSLIRMLGHFPLIFPFGFNGVTIKKMYGKLKRCGDMDAGNLLTECRLIKFIEPYSFCTQFHQRFFLYAGTGAFSRGCAPPYCVIVAI